RAASCRPEKRVGIRATHEISSALLESVTLSARRDARLYGRRDARRYVAIHGESPRPRIRGCKSKTLAHPPPVTRTRSVARLPDGETRLWKAPAAGVHPARPCDTRRRTAPQFARQKSPRPPSVCRIAHRT